jgi:Ni/Co efflux regulator RcnB
MQKIDVLTFAIVGIFGLASFAQAEKPSWAGAGKDEKHEQKKYHDSNKEYNDRKVDAHQGSDVNIDVFFGGQQRDVIRNYYTQEYRSGHCPPGLAKKKNGCMPPGQAKKWKKGQLLPRDVVRYDLPPEVLYQLGPAPAGHRFVRVASDILLISAGTGMIVDAIQDLNNM